MSKALRPYACLTTWPTLVLMNGVALIPHGCFTFRNRENVNEFHSGLHTIPRPQRMVHIPQNCWMWVLNKRKKRKEGGNNPNREDCVVICMLQQRGDLIWFRSALAKHIQNPGRIQYHLNFPFVRFQVLSLSARVRERERETGRV